MKRAAWALAVGWAVVLGLAISNILSGFTEPHYSWARGWLYEFTGLHTDGIRVVRASVSGVLPLFLLAYGGVVGEAWTAPRTWRLRRITGATFAIGAAWIAISVAASALQPLACGRESYPYDPTDAQFMCGWRVELCVLLIHGVLALAFVGLVKRSFGRVADWDLGRLIVFCAVAIWAAWPWLSVARPIWWLVFVERNERGGLRAPALSGGLGYPVIWTLVIGLQLLAGHWLVRNRPGLHVILAGIAVAVSGPLIAILILSDSLSGTNVVFSAFPPLVLLGLLVGAALVKLSRRGAPAG